MIANDTSLPNCSMLPRACPAADAHVRAHGAGPRDLVPNRPTNRVHHSGCEWETEK